MPEWLIDLFAQYGYAIIFTNIFLENTELPMPSETVLLTGTALSHFGHASLNMMIVTAITAAILGDNLNFFIGRRNSRQLFEQHSSHFKLTSAQLADFDRFFEHYSAKVVFATRFITGLRIVSAVLTGASGLP